MTENSKIKADKTLYADAKDTAQNMSKDPGVKAQNVSGGGKTDYSKPLSGDPPVGEHDMDSEVTTSVNQVILTCPQCGKSTLRVEFPDKYEAWVKCPCGFFMGMSNSDWHKMENSPNLNVKIKKMALKREILKPRP
jgi:predicted RNA-binding Zn-ribbon protein involved in translation (DUF1610 family)